MDKLLLFLFVLFVICYAGLVFLIPYNINSTAESLKDIKEELKKLNDR